MGAAVVVMIAEALLLAVLAVFVVALLRSHAEILRRLAALEVDPPASTHPPRDARSVPQVHGPETAPGDIVGVTPAGDAVKVALAHGAPRTLLAFLSTGCAACGPLWDELRAGDRPGSGDRLVIVTKGPERESPGAVSALGPIPHEVVMSTSAWEAFAIPATPHFVLVDGTSGRLLGRGSANSWAQIDRLLSDADSDARTAGRSLGSSSRAARAEEALARAGVGPGHPSLYPSREAPDDGA